MKNLLSLPTYILNFPDDLDLNEFDQKVRKICIDEKIRSAFVSKDHEAKCLDWCIEVSNRYSTLFQIVNAILSFFLGPRVGSRENSAR